MGEPRPLRRWQREALPVTIAALLAGRRGVVVACTGAGKSVWLAELVAQLLALGAVRRVAVTTPTRRLVAQLGATLRERLGEESVGLYYTAAKEADRPVVVACNASARSLAGVLGGGVDLWIADECHETEADGLLAAAEALAPRMTLGLTATPFRASERERLSCFAEVFYRYTLIDAVRDGVVVPWRVVPWTATSSRPVTEVAVELIERETKGYGFVNARSIAECEALAQHLTASGIEAMAVHSQLGEDEQERRMTLLRARALRCVVYVDSLYRGIDEPGAEWLLMLRNVQSRVRFVQEFGRVLRTAPGKTEAVILDPHGLAERFDLLTAESLGRGDGDEGEDTSAGGAAGEGPDEAEVWTPWNIEPLDALSHWTAQLVQAAQADGLLPLRFRFSASARAKTAAPTQVAALKRMMTGARWLPDGHKTLAARVCSGGHAPTMGAAADLLDVLGAMEDRRMVWTPRLRVWLPDLADMDLARLMDVGELSAAGLVWRGWRAVAVVQGRRTLVSEVRLARDGETRTGAAVEAICRALALRPGTVVRTDDMLAAQVVRGEMRPRPEAMTFLALRPAQIAEVIVQDKTGAKQVAYGAASRAARRGR